MTFFQKSFGCRLNQAEGARIETAFEAAGFAPVQFGSSSDVIIINTCTVTQKSENECLKLLRFFRKTQPGAFIVLTGCATATANLDVAGAFADIIVPQIQKDDLLALVLEKLACDLTAQPPGFVKPRTQRALLKVQDGCDCFCTYCIVPFARGTPRSRPFDECLAEARALIADGFQEIVVTGCNTAMYQDSGKNLMDLLRALLALPGLGRLRLSSIEPRTFEREIVRLMAEEPKLCRYLHLPIQSGDNGVLRQMGRRYMVDHVRCALDEAYERMPDISVGTDLIAGFPGETEDAIVKSYTLIETYPFSKVHVFPYNERPKTAAAEMPNQISLPCRKRRTKKLIQLAEERRAEYLQRFIGKPVTMLVERVTAKGAALGWSAEYLACEAKNVDHGLARTLFTFTPTAIVDDTLVRE